MVNIYQHTQYCEGRGYVNPRSLAEAMADEKTNSRLNQDALGKLAAGQRALSRNAGQQQFFARQGLLASALVNRLPTPIANVLGRFQQATQRLIARILPQQVVANAGQLAQQLQQSPNFLSRAVGQVLGFFFSGSKKARNEYDDDEAELREENDLAIQDALFFSEIKQADATTMSKES